MDIVEFREKGYLQEVNRQFFHPLGLALEVVIDKDGTERLGNIWDSRQDPEGFFFGDLVKEEAQRKAAFIQQEWETRGVSRLRQLGYIIQGISFPDSDQENEHG